MRKSRHMQGPEYLAWGYGVLRPAFNHDHKRKPLENNSEPYPGVVWLGLIDHLFSGKHWRPEEGKDEKRIL